MSFVRVVSCAFHANPSKHLGFLVFHSRAYTEREVFPRDMALELGLVIVCEKDDVNNTPPPPPPLRFQVQHYYSSRTSAALHCHVLFELESNPPSPNRKPMI